jgi:hypothetical protein
MTTSTKKRSVPTVEQQLSAITAVRGKGGRQLKWTLERANQAIEMARQMAERKEHKNVR